MDPNPLPSPETTTPTPPKDPATPPTEGAPEKYEDFKLPDGVALEGETLTKAQELFKGLGLSQAAAQSLVDFHAAQIKATADAPNAAYDAMREGWKTAQAADPDIGPKAASIRANIGKGFAGLVAAAGEDAPKVAAEIAEFKSAMDLTGVGDHPAFIKTVSRMLSKWVEPAHVAGAGPTAVTAPGAGPRSVANALYPNLS